MIVGYRGVSHIEVMENSELNNGETFEQWVLRVHNGNASAACAAVGVSRTLQRVLSLIDSPCVARTAMKNVAEFFGRDVESLFPSRLYRQPLFHRVEDAPGYEIIRKKKSISRWRSGEATRNNTLFSLLKTLGYSQCNRVRFCMLLRGVSALHSDVTFAADVSKKLGCSLYEVFPPLIYSYSKSDSNRISLAERSRYIEDDPEAQSLLTQSAIHVDLQCRYREIIEDMLTMLPERQQNVVRMRYGIEHLPLTYREIGTHLGISHALARTEEQRALRTLQSYAEEN